MRDRPETVQLVANEASKRASFLRSLYCHKSSDLCWCSVTRAYCYSLGYMHTHNAVLGNIYALFIQANN